MKKSDLRKLVWGIGHLPVRLRRLYWRKEMRDRSPEVSWKKHRKFMESNRRFYGLADHSKQLIDLDLGLCLRTTKQPLDQACQVLIHEACHLAFNTHHVRDLERGAKKHSEVLRAAERRIMRLLLPKRLV